MLIRFMVDAFYGKYLRKGETAEVEDAKALALIAKNKAVAVEAPAVSAAPEPVQETVPAEPEAPKRRPRKSKVADDTGI